MSVLGDAKIGEASRGQGLVADFVVGELITFFIALGLLVLGIALVIVLVIVLVAVERDVLVVVVLAQGILIALYFRLRRGRSFMIFSRSTSSTRGRRW